MATILCVHCASKIPLLETHCNSCKYKCKLAEHAPGFKPRVSFSVSKTLEDVAGLIDSALDNPYSSFTVESYKQEHAMLHTVGSMEGRAPTSYLADYAINPGCVVVLKDKDSGKLYNLDRAAVNNGLAIFAAESPKCFADFMRGHGDAITGDAFVQCCVLGKVIYG